MKVLEKGTGQKGWSKECRCTGNGNGGGGCGAKLLVEEDDIYGTSKSYYDGSTDYFATFQCPECQVETDIAESKLPSRVWAKCVKMCQPVHNVPVMPQICPNGELPDGPVCPSCGGSRAPSGIDGGSWVHVPDPKKV